MAEDDDDEAFGDFAFAPFQSNSLFNGLNRPDDEDDLWGDFVQPPPESKPSENANNGDHGSGNFASSSKWIKPTGALPLSVFGDAEKEEAVANNLAVAVYSNRGKSNEISKDLDSGLVGSGVSNSTKFSIADLYDRYSQIKPEGLAGTDLSGKVDLVENGVYSTANYNASGSANPELKYVDLSDALGVRDHSQRQLTNKSDNEEFSLSGPSKEDDLFAGWTGEFNGFSSNLKKSPENLLTLNLDIDMNGQKQQLDLTAAVVDDDGGGDDNDDDDEWDFKDAESESAFRDVNNNADLLVHKISESIPDPSGTRISSVKSLDLFGPSNGSIDFFASSTKPLDHFANLSGIYTTAQEVDLIGIQPSSATLKGFASDEQLIIEPNNVRRPLDHSTDIGIEELDKNFEEFSAASLETGPEPKDKDTKSNHHKARIPLSIFGDEEPESGGSSDVKDFFSNQSISAERSEHIASTSSVNSIYDMISNLYNQAEKKTSSTDTVDNLTEPQLNPSSVVSSSNFVDEVVVVDDDDDDDDDSSWDFKDASPIGVDSEASLSRTADMSISSKLKLSTFLDFYLKLKEELSFVAKNHIEWIKNAQGDAALFGEGETTSSFDSEFQLVCNEMNFLEAGALQDHHSSDSHLNEFAQVLAEPQFQRLESEYHLSHKLLQVEKDVGSFMELIRHTNAMLKILSIGTAEEQMVYVSLWSEMISICAQELRHGARIWNDAVAKHVQTQLISEPQGRKFVLALGEIYRVVIVLGVSAELFKPWILSGSVDSPSIYVLLEECRAVWSTSGLEEALSTTLDDDTSLFNSIKHILDLDVHELEKYVFAEKECICRLSLLTARVVPELKIIVWENEQWFVTVANLWANLISRTPPKLPQLKLG